MNRVKPYLLGIPFLLGSVFAFAGIPFYQTVFIYCHLSMPMDNLEKANPSMESDWVPFLLVFLIPCWIVVLLSTTAFMYVYWNVRKQYQKAQKWRLSRRLRVDEPASSKLHDTTSKTKAIDRKGSSLMANIRESIVSPPRERRRRRRKGKLNRIEQEVFWQAFGYLIGLYLTLTFYLVIVSATSGKPVSLFISNTHRCVSKSVRLDRMFDSNYLFWCALVFIVPLQGESLAGRFGVTSSYPSLINDFAQGFLNAIVYFRPRLSRRWELYKKKRKSSSKPTSGVSAGGSSATSTSNFLSLFGSGFFSSSKKRKGHTTTALKRAYSIRDVEPAAQLVAMNALGSSVESSGMGVDSAMGSMSTHSGDFAPVETKGGILTTEELEQTNIQLNQLEPFDPEEEKRPE